MNVLLAFAALSFCVLATVEWYRMPVLARLHLGVATAFGLAALTHPALAVGTLAGHGGDGITVLVRLAGLAGLAGVVVSLVRALQILEPRR